MRLSFLYAIVVACLSFPFGAFAQEGVTVLLSEDGGAYSEFASSLSTGLGLAGGTKTPIRVLSLNKSDELARGGGGQLVVAVGTPAMTAMAASETSV